MTLYVQGDPLGGGPELRIYEGEKNEIWRVYTLVEVEITGLQIML